ncbi:hypothetical protein DIPPA_17930 [Diplonema papillatum]|nr:hypothetical protein DIPPA_17930 [Diplonema papillatum]
MPACQHCDKYFIEEGEYDAHVSVYHPYTTEARWASQRVVERAKARQAEQGPRREKGFALPEQRALPMLLTGSPGEGEADGWDAPAAPAQGTPPRRVRFDALVSGLSSATNRHYAAAPPGVEGVTAAAMRELLARNYAADAQVRSPTLPPEVAARHMHRIVASNSNVEAYQAAHSEVQDVIASQRIRATEWMNHLQKAELEKQREEAMLQREDHARLAAAEARAAKVKLEREQFFQSEKMAAAAPRASGARETEAAIHQRITREIEPTIRALFEAGRTKPPPPSPPPRKPPTRARNTTPDAARAAVKQRLGEIMEQLPDAARAAALRPQQRVEQRLGEIMEHLPEQPAAFLQQHYMRSLGHRRVGMI